MLQKLANLRRYCYLLKIAKSNVHAVKVMLQKLSKLMSKLFNFITIFEITIQISTNMPRVNSLV